MIKIKPTYISLFSSAGVGCYGFQMNNFECIATNELIERRLNIQRINRKCKYESGYILGDIKTEEIKQKLNDEIKKWKKNGNDAVDVVIATPPCQGMSVANHKKNRGDKARNSLIVESVDLIKNIKPRFFIFENVAAFWKTGCTLKNGDVLPIGEMITNELSKEYSIHNEIINFKNYGSKSSRTRTLVIGVRMDLADFISPLDLFPDYTKEVDLFSVIGHLKSLEWGEYDSNDFYHSFRKYPKHMRHWIHEVEQGQSAFDNDKPERRPHQIIDGVLVENKRKNGDKYTRQVYDKVGPCIHTRNDQLASQNTVHPVDDRVFSIRELMLLMTIPSDFKWLDCTIDELNALTNAEKLKVSKKEEMNIRQSIGEAVPTAIFEQIAKKIRRFLDKKNLSKSEIKDLITSEKLNDRKRLLAFVKENKDKISTSSLAMLIEVSNFNRNANSAYYTNKFLINEIVKVLPDFAEDEITILEPSVGAGNFLPALFKKYEHIKSVKLIVVDIDFHALELVKVLYDIPKNFSVDYVCEDFMYLELDKIDLIVGNPPFTKLNSKERKAYSHNKINQESTNLAEYFLEKSLKMARFVSLIMPKNLLNTPEFNRTREYLEKFHVQSIIDFGEKGFDGVLVETINIVVDTGANGNRKKTSVRSIPLGQSRIMESNYIFDGELPYWVIYRNDFFDEVHQKMTFGIFDVFRDRQITNKNSTTLKPEASEEKYVRVLKSRNISDDGEIVDIAGYDGYMLLSEAENLQVFNFMNDSSVYLTPNMTYKPRLIRKENGYITNGSIAILIPKSDFKMSDKQINYIASLEFREFYKIARNYQTRTLNVDKNSCYWFGILK